LISFVATYAGTLLTLDRTRVFPPVDHPSIDRHPTLYRPEGGILQDGFLESICRPISLFSL